MEGIAQEKPGPITLMHGRTTSLYFFGRLNFCIAEQCLQGA